MRPSRAAQAPITGKIGIIHVQFQDRRRREMGAKTLGQDDLEDLPPHYAGEGCWKTSARQLVSAARHLHRNGGGALMHHQGTSDSPRIKRSLACQKALVLPGD